MRSPVGRVVRGCRNTRAALPHGPSPENRQRPKTPQACRGNVDDTKHFACNRTSSKSKHRSVWPVKIWQGPRPAGAATSGEQRGGLRSGMAYRRDSTDPTNSMFPTVDNTSACERSPIQATNKELGSAKCLRPPARPSRPSRASTVPRARCS